MVPKEMLNECFNHAKECYPEEACGFISGKPGKKRILKKVYRMENLMNQFHEKDPANYPRTSKDGYMIDPLSQMKLERELNEVGEVICIIYHSHPDLGAYFSMKDREDALWNGKHRNPGISYLVCGITNSRPDGAVMVEYNEDSESFDSIKLI